MTTTPAGSAPTALVSGAGFAGLTTAFWLHRLGYRVTVVETAPGIRRGGTPVDVRDTTIGIVDRMGILEAIRARSLPPRLIEFRGIDGTVDARIEPDPADGPVDGYEIPRDDLLAILLDAVGRDVEIRFGTTITALTDVPEGVRARFRDGSEGDFAIVLGCDGTHSAVRRLWFGPDGRYARFLHNYFSVAIVGERLIEPDTTRIVSTPGRTLLLNAYRDTTDICLTFHADEQIPYDYHDTARQKEIVRERFADAGTPFTDVLDLLLGAQDFYFDELAQTAMPHWTSGRVALVGDAGYCASPAAGMGGSLAIIGATALYDAFRTTGTDVDAAFAQYERTLRPVVERIQAAAIDVGLATYFPDTAEAIRARTARLAGS